MEKNEKIIVTYVLAKTRNWSKEHKETIEDTLEQ